MLRMQIRCFFPLIFLLLSVSCSTFRVSESYTGREPAHIGAYAVGDKLPRDFVIGYDPHDTTRILTLGDYRGEAVILDAWATWCGSCISKFPLMDSIQRQYGKELAIVLVNVQGIDTPPKVRAFLSDYKTKHPDIDLRVVIEASPLNKQFTFRSIPHYIWIDSNRRIRAFTDADAINDQNLQRLFAGLPIYIPMKLK